MGLSVRVRTHANARTGHHLLSSARPSPASAQRSNMHTLAGPPKPLLLVGRLHCFSSGVQGGAWRPRHSLRAQPSPPCQGGVEHSEDAAPISDVGPVCKPTPQIRDERDQLKRRLDTLSRGGGTATKVRARRGGMGRGGGRGRARRHRRLSASCWGTVLSVAITGPRHAACDDQHAGSATHTAHHV
jgi:hypothetical protein